MAFTISRNDLAGVGSLLRPGAAVARIMSPRQRDAIQFLTRSFWKYLAVRDPERRADLIMVFGNSSAKVPALAADLYRRGLAPRILVTGGFGGRGFDPEKKVSEARWFSDVMVSAGVPQTSILLEEEATNTGENVLFGFRLLVREGHTPRKIILVTRPQLQRRVWATSMKHFPDIQYINVPSDERFDNSLSDAELIHTFVVCYGEIDRLDRYPELGFTVAQDFPLAIRRAYGAAREHIFEGAEIDKELWRD